MNVIAVTQARFGSSRLPGKVLKEIAGTTMLAYHLQRAAQAKRINKLILATTVNPEDDRVAAVADALGIACFRGSEDDVLDRYYQAIRHEHPDYVVRITADCPLIDPAIIDAAVDLCISAGADYASNTINPTYPDGMDVEVFTFAALKKAAAEANQKSDREHVTPYIWRNSTLKEGTLFAAVSLENLYNHAHTRMTVDTAEDFEVLTDLITHCGADKPWEMYSTFLEQNKEIKLRNNHFKRNAGYMKSLNEEITLRNITNFSKSDEYRSKIHDLIPGGAHTYSKGDDQFPILSPAAIARGKGAYVWDLDGNKYLDCSMGLTSVGLGHAYDPVNDRVKQELDKGVNFQRPAAIELEMAEAFLALVPGHDMIKFGKNGSLIITAAIKLARAYNGRKLVAFPGDHPFYSYDDWFIGKTPATAGIPDENIKLSVTYQSDDLATLEALFVEYPGQISCVVSEPEKNAGITDDYLDKLIEIIHRHGAVYIQDEMITGFKTGFPGTITKYNSKPDLATWGKGIANGFSFCALTGKKEIMELGGIRNTGAEKVFLISTTHGGETGPIAAGLATIDEYRTKNVLAHNHAIGDAMIAACNTAIASSGLSNYVDIVNCNWMPLFGFKDSNGAPSSGLRTLAMQEMIRRGVLFQGAFVPCFSHTMDDVAYFADAFSESLEVYGKALEDGFEKYLTGEPAKPVFRKYL